MWTVTFDRQQDDHAIHPTNIGDMPLLVPHSVVDASANTGLSMDETCQK